MQIMELDKYDKFKVVGDDKVYSMGCLDGMDCWCVDTDMNRHYFAVWTEVELMETVDE